MYWSILLGMLIKTVPVFSTSIPCMVPFIWIGLLAPPIGDDVNRHVGVQDSFFHQVGHCQMMPNKGRWCVYGDCFGDEGGGGHLDVLQSIDCRLDYQNIPKIQTQMLQ